MLDKIKHILLKRQTAYKRVFSAADANTVLADLAKFCRANETCFRENEREQALLEGRREVWLRLQHHLRLSPDELWKIYSGDRGQS